MIFIGSSRTNCLGHPREKAAGGEWAAKWGPKDFERSDFLIITFAEVVFMLWSCLFRFFFLCSFHRSASYPSFFFGC